LYFIYLYQTSVPVDKAISRRRPTAKARRQRKSIISERELMLSPIPLSSVCSLSSATFVHPTQALGTLAIH